MTKKQSKPDYSDFDALQQINLSAAGVDIGAEELYVAVPIGRDDESVRAFGHGSELQEVRLTLFDSPGSSRGELR